MQRLCEIREALEKYTASFDASLLSGTDVEAGLADTVAIENIAAYLGGLLGLRWAETEAWRKNGARSPEEELAKKSGTTPGQAKDKLKTARRTRRQPKVSDAASKGKLSPEQNSVISDAVEADPDAEDELVDEALAGASLGESRDSAARTKARACPDLEARRRKIHKERSLRSWTDAEGVWHLRVKNNPEVGAQIMDRIDAITDEIFHTNRREGKLEPREAYAADALARLAAETGTGGAKHSAKAKIIFRVDWSAWLRGYPLAGEVMELVGHGPVAASVISEAIAAGGFIAAVITKANKLTGVAHLGRAPTAAQQSALEWLYPTCAAGGCNARARLQRDHRIDWAQSHTTMLDWLDLLCSHHHGLKTRANWALVDGTGKRPFVSPEDARHPGRRCDYADAYANAPPMAGR